MSYNLHIEREPANPITLEEWRACVKSDPEMRLEQAMAQWVPAGAKIKDGLAGWMNHPQLMPTGQPYFFHFRREEVEVRSPDDFIVEKMKQIAGKLNAVVRGDEGEEY